MVWAEAMVGGGTVVGYMRLRFRVGLRWLRLGLGLGLELGL